MKNSAFTFAIIFASVLAFSTSCTQKENIEPQYNTPSTSAARLNNQSKVQFQGPIVDPVIDPNSEVKPSTLNLTKGGINNREAKDEIITSEQRTRQHHTIFEEARPGEISTEKAFTGKTYKKVLLPGHL